MAVTVQCPACDLGLNVSEDLLGSKLRCKRCQEVFVARAAKTRVGGNGSAVTPPPGRAASGVAARKPAPKPKANDSKKLIYLGVGGGLAFAALAIGLAYALSGKGGSDDKPAQASNVPVNVPSVAPVKQPDAPSATAKAGATADTVKTSAPSMAKAAPSMAGFSEPPKNIPLTLARDVLEKRKKAAVMISCRTDTGDGDGSGWFAEPGIIVTNAHVVGMKEPGEPPPHSIRVYLNSGTPKQRELSGKLLALDRDNDLAVLRVQGNDLPEPMPISPSAEISEGFRLYTMGFPHGRWLADDFTAEGASEYDKVLTTLKVRQSAVTGRMQFANGGAKRITMEGGVDGGNSGGAVIDTAGHVRCVVVEAWNGSNIRFAIPSEFVVHLLQGCVTNVLPAQAYRAGGAVRQPLRAMINDPMKRIKSVAIEIWAGEPGNRIRPAADTKPGPQPGDSARSVCELTYDPNAQVRLGEARPAVGETDLPPLRDGQVYWLQPRYVRTDGSTRWGEAVAADFCGLPVDRKGANLVNKMKSDDVRYLEIDNRFDSDFAPVGRPLQFRTRDLTAKFEERIRDSVGDGSFRVQFKYANDGLNLLDHDQREFAAEQFKELNAAARGMAIDCIVTNRGMVRSPKANMTDVPQQYRRSLGGINDQFIGALETLGMALPAKDVAAGESWNFDINQTFYMPQGRINMGNNKVGVMTPVKDKEEAVYRLAFTYHGSRVRNGREEAVITYVGHVTKGDQAGGGSADAAQSGKPPDLIDSFEERKKGLFGLTRGAALVDLETGATTLAKSRAEAAIDFRVKIKYQDDDGENKEVETDMIFAALSETALQRFFTPKYTKLRPEVYLPEEEIALNPFVGAPDPNMASSATGGNSDGSAASPNATGMAGLQMPKEVLDRVKKQACLIMTKTDDGGGAGSGWLAEPGIVITNAHVISMLARNSRPPVGVDVYFEPGTPNEKVFPAKVLTVDHDQDLAVLQLPTTEGLPEPMAIVPSTDLYETQRLLVLGFPWGTRLAKMFSEGNNQLKTQLSIRDTSVAGRVENRKTGFLRFIQVEGGLIHGNSGGAIVDTNGAVRCVAVQIKPGTKIGMGVPSEYAQRLLWGFPLEIKPQLAYMDGSAGKMPIEVKFGDPLKRVTKVQLDYWVGKPGMPRRPSTKEPKQLPSDGPRSTVDCTYDTEKAIARGEFVLPDAQPGSAYWVQPRYTDGTGNEKWGDAVFFNTDGPPVERRAMELKAKFKKGSARLINVITDAEYRYVVFGSDRGHQTHLNVTLIEEVAGNVGKQHVVNYKIEDVKFGQPKSRAQYIRILYSQLGGQQLFNQIKNIVAQAIFNSDGTMAKADADTSKVNPIHRGLFQEFANQVMQGVQVCSVKLPNRKVEVGESWEQPTNLVIETKSRLEPSLFELKMTYMGVRARGGREEAVLMVKGAIRNDPNKKSVELKSGDSKEEGDDKDKEKEKDEPKGKDDGKDPKKQSYLIQAPGKAAKKALYGDVHGKAYVDLETGQVSFCELFMDVDAEIMVRDPQTKTQIPVRAGGTIAMTLTRHLSVR